MADMQNTIIIGAGISGLCMGVQLQRKLGYDDFCIYEKGGGLSGTWYHNKYPGAACDVPCHLYSLSFEQNPDWTQVFADSDEIERYWEGVARKWRLRDRIRFKTECLGAEWQTAGKYWVVTFRDLDNGQEFERTCRVLISAVGVLAIPRDNPVPKNDAFKGDMWHSAKWRTDVDLRGKNIVVVGNGCSATQFVPVIAEQAGHVTQVVRGAHFLNERPQAAYGWLVKWLFRKAPILQTLYRSLIFGILDSTFRLFYTANVGARKQLTADFLRHMRKTTPQKYHDIVVPKFTLGVKRRVYDTDYLACLHRDNVTLTDTPIGYAVSDGVVLKDGSKIAADAIVYANGFKATDYLVPLRIVGRKGQDLASRWKSQGGARAYLGTSVPEFPNFAMLLGPNTVQGHNSVIFTIECAVNYVLRSVIRPLKNSGWKQGAVVECTQAAENAYNDWLRDALAQTVWGASAADLERENKTSEGDGVAVVAATTDDKTAALLQHPQKKAKQEKVHGWYVDPVTGHNPTIFPAPQALYWWKTLTVDRHAWRVTGV